MSLQKIALLAAVLLPAGCIEPDPDFPPPIAPLPLAQRQVVVVAPVGNDSPSPQVAQWCYETRLLLVELLERSRRFVVAETGAGPALTVRFVDVRDELLVETLVYRAEQQTNAQRRAVVAMEWSAAGGSRPARRVESEELVPSKDPLPMPTAEHLSSGSFWESPYGRATRRNLDQVVRSLASPPADG